MATSHLRILIWGVMLSVAPVERSSAQWVSWCSVVPEEPTSEDVVTLTIGGQWGDSCVPQEPLTQVVGSTVHMDTDVSHPGVECLGVVTEWSVSDSVGPLPTGTCTVTASAYDGPALVAGPDEVCTFEVLKAPPVVPAISAWGVVAMTLLVLAAGTSVFVRGRRRVPG
jgi:hypothetical protein